MRKAKRIEHVLSAAELSRLKLLRQQIDGEKDEIIAEARRHKAAHDATAARLRDVMRLLHCERTRQGLSLSDIQSRTGISPPALSRLETEPDANPTLTTIARYAAALGKDLQIPLTDKARSSLDAR